MTLAAYYEQFQRVFPIAGQIETVAAYDEYLRDPALEWDVVMLSDADGRIIGGIHWQVLRSTGVRAPRFDALAWVEHVWLVDEPAVRNYRTFRSLVAVLRKHMERRGAAVGFMELNDPDKMTADELAQDTASRARLRLWAHVGIHELVVRSNDGQCVSAPYAQPAMGSGPAVQFLSLGFFGLHDITCVRVSASDYLRILYRAHATIRGLDPAVDPTCRAYTAAIDALGDADLELVPLKRR